MYVGNRRSNYGSSREAQWWLGYDDATVKRSAEGGCATVVAK